MSDLSKIDAQIPFEPSNYEESQTNVRVATRDIKQLLNVPTQNKYVQQQELLEGEHLENWEKIYEEVKEHLETEVTLHQVANVTELGWESANENRPT